MIEVEHIAIGLVGHARHRVAARVCQSRHVEHDDRAHSLVAAESTCQLNERRLAREQHAASAVQSDNARPAVERAEHDDHATVLAQVRNGLDPAAGQVEVGHLKRTQDSKGAGQALRRAVHQALRIQRSRRDEEHRLTGHPCGELVIDGLELVSHETPP